MKHNMKKNNLIKQSLVIVLTTVLLMPISLFAQTPDQASPPVSEPVVGDTPDIGVSDPSVSTAPTGVGPSPVDTSVPVTADTQIADPIPVDSGVPSADSSQNSSSPQNTATDQQSTDGTTIVDTTDPQQTASPISVDVGTTTASTTPIIPPDPVNNVIDISTPPADGAGGEILGVATTTPADLPNPAQNEVPVLPQDTTPTDPIPDQTPIVEIIQTEQIPVITVTADELQPVEKYLFSLDGQTIPAKERPNWSGIEVDKNGKKLVRTISNTPVLSPDSDEGSLNISASCSDPYFVVLLYLLVDDYDKSPNKYIYNKAFDCVGGSYDYSLNDLPGSIADGTYYLLIAGQGNEGPWKPITALIPVTITKEVTYE